jgi:fructokinase
MNVRLCIFGEVLFDHFPDGERVLGGAPFNVAWHLQAFGLEPHFLSRVGDDEQGREVLQAMRDWGMDTAGLQFDRRQATGQVSVELEDGEPTYNIVAPCAYDRIVPPEPLPKCDLLYHGSLALRDPVSRRTIDIFLNDTECRVFVDVNLRPPWWQHDDVLALVSRADWVKINQDELLQLHPGDLFPEDRAQEFRRIHDLQGLVVTRGKAGADLYSCSGDCLHVEPLDDIEVVDTVGAGDAFASVLMLGLAHHWPLQTTLERAQTFASAIVGQRGATVAQRSFYQPFIEKWQA